MLNRSKISVSESTLAYMHYCEWLEASAFEYREYNKAKTGRSIVRQVSALIRLEWYGETGELI